MDSVNGNDKDEVQEEVREQPGEMCSELYATGVCGLANMGNTCFMNSALQCLASIPQLVEFFVSGEYHFQLNKSNPLSKSKGALAQHFGQLIQAMWCGKNGRVVPSSFRQEIVRINPDFKGYYQQDTQEFTMFLLDGLHDDLNRAKNEPLESPQISPTDDALNADQAWRVYKNKDDSIITDLMHGQFKSKVVCAKCGHSSVTFEPFCFLSLQLPQPERNKNFINRMWKSYWNREIVTLEDCLSEFSSPEEIESECSKCHGKTSSRTLNIWRLPQVLIVHLKRYQFCDNGDTHKIETSVEFMVRNFHLDDEAIANPEERNNMYNLIGATLHGGTFSYGHYTSYVTKNDNWYLFSDSSFEKMAPYIHEKQNSPDVYILYYQRQAPSNSTDVSVNSIPNDTDSDSKSSYDTFNDQGYGNTKEPPPPYDPSYIS